METLTIFAWGFLGMVQALLLPGLCVTSAFPSWNRLQRTLFALPLSLLVNYYLACFLVLLGLYGRASLLLVLAAEVAWLIRCARRSRSSPLRYPPLRGVSDFLLLILGAAALTKYGEAWGRNFGDIFQMWDAIVSWNAWARTWYEGALPSAGMYPHGLPITYSIPYVFLQRSDIETFSKAASGFYFLGAVAALLELGFRRIEMRRIAWLLAYVYPSVQAAFLQSHWQSGYADVPLAAFLIFAFCVSFFEGREMPWLFGLIAGAASLVKQPGLIFTAASPLLVAGWGRWKSMRSLWLRVGIAAGLAAVPWYLFILARIYGLQKDGNNVGYLASIVSGGLGTRWAFSLNLLTGYGGTWPLIAGALLALLGIFYSRVTLRWVALLGLPYFLIWGTLFGYDIRNVSMALFPFSLAASAGIVFLLEMLERFVPRAFRMPSLPKALQHEKGIVLVVIGLTLLLSLVALRKPAQHWRASGGILGWEKEQRIDLGDFAKANRTFYNLAHCSSLQNVTFYSNHSWFRQISEFREFFKYESCQGIFKKLEQKERAYAMVTSEDCPEVSGKMKQVSRTLHREDGLAYVFGLNESLPDSCPSN